MKQIIQTLLEKSGKRTKVHYAEKERRTKFDEDFGKEKLDLINNALGKDQNKQLIFEKMEK
jgi:hypothetical protein